MTSTTYTTYVSIPVSALMSLSKSLFWLLIIRTFEQYPNSQRMVCFCSGTTNQGLLFPGANIADRKKLFLMPFLALSSCPRHCNQDSCTNPIRSNEKLGISYSQDYLLTTILGLVFKGVLRYTTWVLLQRQLLPQKFYVTFYFNFFKSFSVSL